VRAHPLQSSFNAGELSPLLMGRPDLAKYANACSLMENALPLVQGPAKRRGGTRFTANTKNDAKVWLGRFRFSRTQSYIIEFGHLYVRFFANRAQLVSGTPVEVATPYTSAQLTNDDGSFALSIVQDGDVLFIASGSHPIKKLTRLGATDWTLTDFATRNGPFQEQNANKSLRIYVGARTGTGVTATASASYFTESMVGAFLRLDVENFTMPPWEPGKHFADQAITRSDGKTYLAVHTTDNPITATTITGSRTLIHEEGRVLDGSGATVDEPAKPIGILWEFRDAGYGLAKIVSVTSPTVAVVDIVADMPMPDHVVGSGNATNAWSIGAWGTHAGAEYPSRLCFWKNRFCVFGRRAFWMSVPRDFDNFARDIVGQVRADCAITYSIPTTDPIRWVEPGKVIYVGTAAGEFIIKKQTDEEALGPNNIDAFQDSAIGSRALQPVTIGKEVFYAEAAGQAAHAAQFDGESFEERDMNDLAEHIASGVIVDWAWQRSPERVLWAVLATGELIAATVDKRNDVYPWHRHPTQGLVEAVNVIPSPDGKRDDVWLVVLRMVAGVPKRFVEVMDAGDEKNRAQEDCYFVDAGLTYSGPAATTISGLGHLAGETVTIASMGGAHPPRVVSAQGTITLERPSTKCHVGFGSRFIAATMPLDGGARLGTSSGKTKRATHFTLRFHRTLGAKIGPSLDKLSTLQFRKGSDPLGQAPPLFTGVSERIEYDGDYEQDAIAYIVNDQPLPITLCALMPEFDTHERA
jgi:hypothetical protein